MSFDNNDNEKNNLPSTEKEELENSTNEDVSLVELADKIALNKTSGSEEQESVPTKQELPTLSSKEKNVSEKASTANLENYLREILNSINKLDTIVMSLASKVEILESSIETIKKNLPTSQLERNLQLLGNVLVSDLAARLSGAAPTGASVTVSTQQGGSQQVVPSATASRPEPQPISEEGLVKPSKLFGKKK